MAALWVSRVAQTLGAIPERARRLGWAEATDALASTVSLRVDEGAGKDVMARCVDHQLCVGRFKNGESTR